MLAAAAQPPNPAVSPAPVVAPETDVEMMDPSPSTDAAAADTMEVDRDTSGEAATGASRALREAAAVLQVAPAATATATAAALHARVSQIMVRSALPFLPLARASLGLLPSQSLTPSQRALLRPHIPPV